jgi:hypothetical protein
MIRVFRFAAALCFTIGLSAGCASEGGIVGTGNRPYCEAQAKQGGAVSEECRREAAAPR